MSKTTSGKVEYRQLGQSGLKISVPIVGCMSFGDKRWQPWVLEADEAVPLLKAAYDRGINTWDTANMYSNGASEEIVGQAIKKYQIPRQKVVILTKCHFTVGEKFEDGEDPPETVDYVNQRGLSRQAIFNAVEASLRRLDTSYIDLYQIHRFDPNVPIAETMKALHDLVESGKVRYIGASSMLAHQFAMMQFCAEKNGWTKFISMQNHYTLLYREEEREMNAFCKTTGVGMIPWSPLAFGALARPRAELTSTTRGKSDFPFGLSEEDKVIIDRVEELAKKKDWPMSQVALAWSNARVSSPIIGFSSASRMDQALGANGKTLTDEETKYLEEPYRAKPIWGIDD